MKKLIFMLALLSPVAMAGSVADDTIHDMSWMSEKRAIDTIEGIVIGYFVGVGLSGCTLDDKTPSRRTADMAWLDIKYGSDKGESLVMEASKWLAKHRTPNCGQEKAPE